MGKIFFLHLKNKRTGYMTSCYMVLFFLIAGCSSEAPEPEILSVSDEEAAADAREAREALNAELADGFELSLWASEKLLGDPIGIHMQDDGSAFVTVTTRSRSSEFDIRDLDPKWLQESMRWESVEDRRNYLRTELSPERSDENRWLPDRNEDGSHDWRDLAVEQEKIVHVKDLTGSGLANEAMIFARGFDDEVSDVAGSVVSFKGDVFTGVGPDMWRISDTSGDGMGDLKKSISHGYNVHIGFSGHGMSGATVGPDGRIYWSIGDMGFNVVDQEGKRWYYPNQGAILRSEPDGSDFEVYAAGLRNTHEFVFDKFGNLITVDNDGDHPGEYERLVYLINGSDSGWRINWQFGKYTDPKNNSYKVWMDESYFTPHFEAQSAHILPPLARYHSGPAGMVYNPGTALGDEWKDHFFVMSFRGSPANSGIFAFTLKENGASFELDTDEQITRGLLAVGLDFGPDGALYMTDWIQGWMQKDEGRIWKMDYLNGAESAARQETKELLGQSFSEFSTERLAELLGHDDMRIRRNAQFELADRDEQEAFVNTIENSESQLARIHAIWGVGQSARVTPAAAEPLLNYLNDPDPEIRAQSAKTLGDVRYLPAAHPITQLLGDESSRVRLLTAEALGRIGDDSAFEHLVRFLEENNDEDIYLRHAGAIALERTGSEEMLSELAEHLSQPVRVAAVVALKRKGGAEVARFLEDEDEFVATNAARAIIDDLFIDDAIPRLAAVLNRTEFLNEPLLRRAINANIYTGNREAADRLAAFALREDIPEYLRVEAINTLEHWEEPSIFDRVTGRYRGQIYNDQEDAKRAIASVAETYLSSGSSELQVAALEAIAGIGYEDSVSEIVSLVTSSGSEEVRKTALNTLMELNYSETDEILAVALDDLSLDVRMNALHVLVNIDLPADTQVSLLSGILEGDSVEEQKRAYNALARIDQPESHQLLAEQLHKLMEGTLMPDVHLDLILAAEASDSDEIRSLLDRYEAEKPADDKLEQYRETLYGGNIVDGREVFYNDIAAQCIRCHVVDERGSDVGPDLTTIADRMSREEILLSLVDPSAQPVSGFTLITVTKTSGETHRGVFKSESENLLTLIIENSEVEIPKPDIRERVQSPSAMPAMGELLSRTQIRDLIEYVSTLKTDK